jgi:transketolase
MSNELRVKIVDMITKAGEGHIPSSFSVIDIIDTVYGKFLKHDPKRPNWEERDYFVLSKGHAAAALFVTLQKYGYFSQSELDNYGGFDSILGGHPDRLKVPGAEASTGSLGHGFPFSMGIALGLKIKKMPNKVITLVGDGESHEGTIWETALVAQNLKLNNLCCIVDYNGSAAQILPHPNIVKQWESFGWKVKEANGHDKEDIAKALKDFYGLNNDKPFCIIAHTIKGKGVGFMEVHGPWHHKIPNPDEYKNIMLELNK